MTGRDDSRSGWDGQQHQQPYYQQQPPPPQPYGPPPQQYPPQQYPPQQYPPQQYPPQQYPPQQQPPGQYQQPYGQPQYPPAGYPPPQQPYGQPPQYPPAQQPPAQYQQPYGQPIVLPIEGKGVAKLAGRLNKRSLVISQEGFALEAKKNAFRIAWPELRRITITTAFHQDRTKLVAPKVWRVRVVLDAADPGFVQRHPEIGGLQGKYGGSGPGSYGLPLGPVLGMVGPLAHALGQYGGQLFGGVIEEGQVLGFGYL